MPQFNPVEACRDNVIIAARGLEERNYDDVSKAILKVELAKLDFQLDQRKQNTEART